VTETSTTKTTVVEREAVEYLAWLSALAIDGQIELPEFLGNDKNWAFARASDILTHQEHGAGGKRSIRLIPVSFKIIGFHKDMVEEFILDLGGEQVEADHPVFCVLANSFDFRWDSRQALDVVWPASKQP
jgi:hypothetical protein